MLVYQMLRGDQSWYRCLHSPGAREGVPESPSAGVAEDVTQVVVVAAEGVSRLAVVWLSVWW